RAHGLPSAIAIRENICEKRFTRPTRTGRNHHAVDNSDISVNPDVHLLKASRRQFLRWDAMFANEVELFALRYDSDWKNVQEIRRQNGIESVGIVLRREPLVLKVQQFLCRFLSGVLFSLKPGCRRSQQQHRAQ